MESKLKKGSTFHVFFPITGKAITPIGDVKVSLPTGNERILFVDDEKGIVNIGREILERLGYEVTACTSSVEALEIFSSDSKGFDLVVTDQSMPYIAGSELAQKLMEIKPDIPVILCTGYSTLISKEKANEIGICEFVMKPLEMHELARTVRRVLDEKGLKKLADVCVEKAHKSIGLKMKGVANPLKSFLKILIDNVFSDGGQNWFKKIESRFIGNKLIIAGIHDLNMNFSLFMGFYLEKALIPFSYKLTKNELKENKVIFEFQKN